MRNCSYVHPHSGIDRMAALRAQVAPAEEELPVGVELRQLQSLAQRLKETEAQLLEMEAQLEMQLGAQQLLEAEVEEVQRQLEEQQLRHQAEVWRCCVLPCGGGREGCTGGGMMLNFWSTPQRTMAVKFY